MGDIAGWLRGLGLERYAEAFAAAEIDEAALPHLTEGDLKELGLPIGPRRKVLAVIAALNAGAAEIAPSSASPPPPRSEAERRQLTVMFADLVGSTAMAQTMDPEELRGVIRGFQDAAAGAIARYEGHVAKFMGDGVLAYFGWPRAHEDDAERAVRSGLALIEAIGIAPHKLMLRVGIATGVVVVGDVVGEGGAREEAAVGETLNLAARLQQLAEPGAIVVAPETHALLGHVFELSSLGPRELKGIAGEVEAWRVLGERSIETRFEAARGPHLGRLVGREQELALALARWELARAGEGQAVLLRAEAGIGKSRLVAELRQRLATPSTTVLNLQGSPHHTGSALYPVIQQIARACRVEAGDQPGEKLVKLGELVARSSLAPDRAVPVLAALLSLPTAGPSAMDQLTPQEQKSETLAVLSELLVSVAKTGPSFLIVEDLHWFDRTSRELLDQVVARIESLPVLMLATFRPEIATPWEGRGYVTAVTLSRLGRGQVEAQISSLSASRGLPADVVEQIIAKSDGVPLYVEELTKAAIESAASAAAGEIAGSRARRSEFAVPSSLRASLLARLDRLPAAREVAQVGAVLGREFDFDLLAAVAPGGEPLLAAALEDLHRAELIFPRGTPPRTRWTFKHALIQDAAYETLLKSSRADLHSRIAETISSRFAPLAESEPETVARYYEAGGKMREACAFWRKAGQRALSRYAGAEAAQHFARALELASRSDDRPLILDLDISHCEALLAAGEFGTARDRLLARMSDVRAEADIEGLARVVLAIGVAERETGTTQSSTIELHDEMLGRIPEENATLHLRVLNSLGRGLTLVGDFGRASICANQAIALARRLGSQRDLTEALELRFLIPVGLVPEEIDEYRNLGRELAAATWLEGDPWTYLRILIHQAYWSAQFGDGAAFRGWLARWFDVVRERKLHYLIAVTAQARAMVAILQGDFAAAERFAGEAFEVGQRELGGMAHGIYGIHMFTVRREQGRLGEVVGLFKRFVDEAPAGSAWEPGFALMASDLGFDAPARRSLGKLASSDFALPLDAMRTTTLAFFAEVAVKLSDRESAKSIYGLLLPYAHMTVTVGLTVVCYGSAGRFLGLLADLLEDQPAAEQHFERALEVNTRMEAWPWLAHTQADYAAALRRWGSAADLARAAELAAAARASAERLGMAFLQKKLAAQLN